MLEGDKLYGRGGADDGYAIFASLTAIDALRTRQAPARALRRADRGLRGDAAATTCPRTSSTSRRASATLSLVVCLDSGCANYDQLWSTTSLRGLVVGNLEVSLLTEGVHSGDGSRRRRVELPRHRAQLLDRLEDAHTGADQARRARRRRSRASACCRPQRTARGARRRGVEQVPAPARRRAGDQGQRRADPQPHLAPRARDHRRRRLPADRQRRQRAAPAHRGSSSRCASRRASIADAAADAVKRRSRRIRRTARRSRSTDVGASAGWDAPRARAVARAGARRRVADALRQAGDVHGRGRHDPVHGHARREVPQGAVLHHRRARPRLATRTARTSSCTSRPRASSRCASPTCSRRTRPSRTSRPGVVVRLSELRESCIPTATPVRSPATGLNRNPGAGGSGSTATPVRAGPRGCARDARDRLERRDPLWLSRCPSCESHAFRPQPQCDRRQPGSTATPVRAGSVRLSDFRESYGFNRNPGAGGINRNPGAGGIHRRARPREQAHGPNEFLHIPTARRLTCCVADVLATHATATA